jgi:hypothetical protein
MSSLWIPGGAILRPSPESVIIATKSGIVVPHLGRWILRLGIVESRQCRVQSALLLIPAAPLRVRWPVSGLLFPGGLYAFRVVWVLVSEPSAREAADDKGHEGWRGEVQCGMKLHAGLVS